MGDFMNKSFEFEIYPSRITEAREARLLNISQLADIIGVTRQMVSKYEQGLSQPSETILSKLSTELNFPFEFFFKPVSDKYVTDGTVFYRSLKSSDAKVRSMIRVKCNWAGEVYSYLNQYLKLPELNLPQLDLMVNKNSLTEDEIEEIALSVRNYWGLGTRPIENLVYLLEKNGIVISSSEINCEKADACSEINRGVPIIFLDKGLKSACRIRFSLAHELGHILMHGYITKDDLKNKITLDRIEHEANRFASAFLLPADSFIQDIRSMSLTYFIALKSKWKASIAAMIYRCQDLNLLDDDQVLMLRKQISYKKWIKAEPLDDEIKIERPKLIKSAAELLFNKHVISKGNFVNNFRWNILDLANVCGCGKEFFLDNLDVPISLRLM